MKNFDLSITSLVLLIERITDKKISIKGVKEDFSITVKNNDENIKLIKALSMLHQDKLNDKMKIARGGKKSEEFRGRPTKLHTIEIKEMMAIYRKGKTSITDLCKIYEISRFTFYRYVKSGMFPENL